MEIYIDREIGMNIVRWIDRCRWIDRYRSLVRYLAYMLAHWLIYKYVFINQFHQAN